MAIKDWRKTYESNDAVHWQNDRAINWIFIKKKGSVWEVENLPYGGSTNVLGSGFKNKASATDFAKSYMRKN